MPYQQVFELQDSGSIHGSQIVDQSINLASKSIPGSITAELFPTSLNIQSTDLLLNTLQLTSGPSSSNRQLIFAESYSIYADNTGSGADSSRLWIDGPDEGEVVIGPRTGANYLDQIRLRAQSILLNWEDAGGDAASMTLPSGLIYDWGWATDASLSTFSTTRTSLISDTASVPEDISVTIMVWAWMRLESDATEGWRALDITIGGTVPVNPAIAENPDHASATSGASSGSTGSGGTGTTGSSPNLLHDHGGAVSGSLGFHTHSGPSHTHSLNSHTHALANAVHSDAWINLSHFALRSFTPTGTTVTINGNGWSQTGTEQPDLIAIMWMVIIN